MDVSPDLAEVGGYDLNVQGEETDNEEDQDLCRICRSPEETGNPLRYPCLCRGSIKYVHQDCLRLWLNRRGYKKCEVCGRSYSFVPVYSENAPERLPCSEFLIGVLLRVALYMKLIVPWILVFLFNTYCNSLHPLGQSVAADFQRDFWMSWMFTSFCAGLFHIMLIGCFMSVVTLLRMVVGDLNIDGVRAENFIGDDGLRLGVISGVVKLLLKYMKILCDWYFHQLVYFLGRPRELIHVPPNAPLHEFGVIRRLLFFMDDDAFAGLAISVYVSTLFVLLPFSIGSIILTTVGGIYSSGYSPVTLGYMIILSISFAYFGILFTLRHYSCPAIVRWFSLGLNFITMELPCLLWVLSVQACKNLFFIKDALVLCIKFGALPWIIGSWLEICISPMFGTTISQRIEILSQFPCLIIIRLWSGLFCVLIALDYMELFQETIHKRTFWYLLDVTDPDYKITKLNLCSTFFAFASHGVLLVILTYLPIKAITLVSPSFFPLELWITDEKPLLGVYAIYFKLMTDGPKWLIRLTKPATKLIVQSWIITVSSWLQLSDFLLVVPQPRREFDDNSWFVLYSIAEGSFVISIKSHDVEEDIQKEEEYDDQRNNRFLPRIALMLVLAVLCLFLYGTTFMALPILVGRLFFDSISFIRLRFEVKHDDLCAFWIGCYILRATYISTCFVYDHIQKGRIDMLLKYVLIRIRNGLFFSIWISVIPGLLGLLIDLMIIIPSRVPLDESLVYLLIQDWLIGVVVLHIWTFLTMFTPVSCFATKAWQGKFEKIRNVGINRLPSTWLLRDVICSIINTLLTTLCVPYLLVKAVFPLLGFPQNINSAAQRFIWPAVLAFIAVWFMAKLTRDIIIYLHQLVFNERYLVGERVDNLTEDIEQIIVHGV